MSTVQERVVAGVAWLNATVEEWRDRISPPDLNIESPCLCICGWVFGDGGEVATFGPLGPWPWTEKRLTGFDFMDSITGPVWLEDHGFEAETIDQAEWDALQVEWERVLADPEQAS